MKLTFVRRIALLAVALGLAACGGKAEFTVGGTVIGLFDEGLIMTSNGQNVSVKAGATSYSFPGSIGYGSTYNVTITGQPKHETCTVSNPTDTAGRFAVINVQVNCTRNAHGLSGKIVGLTGEGLELTNGSTGGSTLLAALSTNFAFAAVLDGAPYGVTVLTQPAGQICTVANGVGTMGETDVSNILVTCVAKP